MEELDKHIASLYKDVKAQLKRAKAISKAADEDVRKLEVLVERAKQLLGTKG